MDIFVPLYIDTHRVGGAGIFPYRPQTQAGCGTVQIAPHEQSNGHRQIDHNIVVKQAPADNGQLGQAGNSQIGKALLDVGVVIHGGPADRLDAVAHKEVDAQAEGGQGQAGDVLVRLEGNSQQGKEQAAQGAGQEGHQNAHPQAVGVAAHNIAKDGSHGHNALHAQVQAA